MIWSGRMHGPTAPATYTESPAASRAMRTAWRLISTTFSESPYGRRAIRLAPKVFVSITSAPASTYSRWIWLMSFGLERESSSKQVLMKTPRS